MLVCEIERQRGKHSHTHSSSSLKKYWTFIWWTASCLIAHNLKDTTVTHRLTQRHSTSKSDQLLITNYSGTSFLTQVKELKVLVEILSQVEEMIANVLDQSEEDLNITMGAVCKVLHNQRLYMHT